MIRSLIALCLLFTYSSTTETANAAEVPKPVGHIYVQDFANILNAEQKEELVNYGMQLDDATGAQLVVMTIDSLEGEAIEEYSVKVFREYGIGQKEKNNGVLFLVAPRMKERCGFQRGTVWKVLYPMERLVESVINMHFLI